MLLLTESYFWEDFPCMQINMKFVYAILSADISRGIGEIPSQLMGSPIFFLSLRRLTMFAHPRSTIDPPYHLGVVDALGYQIGRKRVENC